jgi:hypothetical protein
VSDIPDQPSVARLRELSFCSVLSPGLRPGLYAVARVRELIDEPSYTPGIAFFSGFNIRNNSYTPGIARFSGFNIRNNTTAMTNAINAKMRKNDD